MQQGDSRGIKILRRLKIGKYNIKLGCNRRKSGKNKWNNSGCNNNGEEDNGYNNNNNSSRDSNIKENNNKNK